jgi:hypothetical protein
LQFNTMKIQNQFKRILKIFGRVTSKILIVLLIVIWLFAGWPVVWKNPRIPPEVKEALAIAPGQYITTALKVAPSAAAGVSVTPSGTAWANSNWVQVIASTPAAIVVAGLVVGGGPSVEFEFDIGKGPAGAETVVATISGNTESGASSPRWLPLPIPVDNIEAGQRVAVRVRKAGTATTAYTVKLVYYEKPISGSVATTPNPSLVAPSAAAGVSITPSGTAWANSGWAQVIASTGDAIVLGGITVNPAVAVEYEIDVGVGAAGSEAVVTTIRGRSVTAGAPQTIILNPLLDNIPSGSRVSVRLRKAGTNTTAWTVKLIYYNKTNLGVGANALTTKPLKWSPTSAAGASVTLSGTAWANSNWVQLIASAPANLAIAAVQFVPADAVDFEIEFGIGAAGSEVPIGLVRGRVLSTTLGNIFTVNIAPLINSVPAGSRLAVRIRTSGTVTTAWTVSVGYYENNDTTNVLNAPHSSLPFSADSVTVTNSATAWANSSYVELTPGLRDDIYINRVIVGPSAASQFEIDIATGAAGSEVVQTTVAGQAVSLTGNSVIDLPAPLKVSANTRIAMRIRTSLTTAGTWYLALEYALDEQMKQSAYRFFNNLDSTNVGTPLAAQDTAATLSSSGAAFRLRMLLHMTTNKLATLSAQSFKLQFAQRGSDNQCDSNFNGESYTDVTTTSVIAYNNNPTPADGATLTANANDPTHGADTVVNQTYEELNNFTNSVAAISSGQDGKWDFALKDNGAPESTTYCFRVVKADGTLLDTYTVIPQITTASAGAITCTLSSTSTSFSALTPSAVSTSSPDITITITSSGGFQINVKDTGNGTNPGLYKSTSPTYLIQSQDATLSAGTDGYGIQSATTTAGSGGIITLNSKYNKTGNDVGGLSLTDVQLASSTTSVTNREIIIKHKAAVSFSAPSGSYSDTITYTCSAQ